MCECECAFYNINYVHGRHDERMNKAKGYMKWDNGMVRKEQSRAEIETEKGETEIINAHCNGGVESVNKEFD